MPWLAGLFAIALPVLEAHYTGAPCDHARALCQYEVQKAILKCRGDFAGSWQVSHDGSVTQPS